MSKIFTTAVASLGIVLGLAFGLGCNSSEFGGSSGKSEEKDDKKNGRPSGKDGGDSDAGSDADGGPDSDSDGDGADGDAEGADAADSGAVDGNTSDTLGTSGEGGDADGGGADSAGDAASGGELVTEDEASCLLRKGDNFRILFVFDNSASTQTTDPTNIRRQAGLRLVDQFTDFVKANPKVIFKTATVSFNNKAVPGAHGWVKLSDTSRASIEEDLTAATTGPGIGTHFDKAMPAASQLFSTDAAKASEKRQRTYMIFLSDGQANGANDDIADIVPLVTTMVNDQGAAVYSIIIGAARRNDAVQMMQAIALPAVGVVGPDHVGTYVHAPDAAAIDKAFADFFKKVTGC